MKVEISQRKKQANNDHMKTKKDVTKKRKKKWVTMESKKKLKNTYIKTTLQNLCDETKTVLRGKSIAIVAFLKKQKKCIK